MEQALIRHNHQPASDGAANHAILTCPFLNLLHARQIVTMLPGRTDNAIKVGVLSMVRRYQQPMQEQ